MADADEDAVPELGVRGDDHVERIGGVHGDGRLRLVRMTPGDVSDDCGRGRDGGRRDERGQRESEREGGEHRGSRHSRSIRAAGHATGERASYRQNAGARALSATTPAIVRRPPETTANEMLPVIVATTPDSTSTSEGPVAHKAIAMPSRQPRIRASPTADKTRVLEDA